MKNTHRFRVSRDPSAALPSRRHGKSRSLFVATPPFIHARVTHETCVSRRPRERDFVKVKSHVSIFEQSDKNDQQRADGLCVRGRE